MTEDKELGYYELIYNLVDNFGEADCDPSELGPVCKQLYDAYDGEHTPENKKLYGEALDEMICMARQQVSFWEDLYNSADCLKDEVEEKLSEQEEVKDGQKE